MPLLARCWQTSWLNRYSSCAGVEPKPLTNTATSFKSGRSRYKSSIIRCANFFAGRIFSRRIPGSPWIPTPYSISSSANIKVGVPLAGTVHEVNAKPRLMTLSAAFCAIALTCASS